MKTVFSVGDFRRVHSPGLLIPANPMRISQVYSRSHYEHSCRGSIRAWRDAHRFVRPGDWDVHVEDFEANGRFRNMLSLHAHKDDFTRSQRYRDLTAALEAGKPKRGFGAAQHDFTSYDGIDRYCRYYIDLMDRMLERGWEQNDGDESCKVAVDRNGTMLKWPLNGFHRLAAARIVGLDCMLVEVVQVHADWAARHACGSGTRRVERLTAALLALAESR